jgi:enoyl-CoA hydratase/carnithine racemase
MASRRHNSTSSANSLRVIQVEREGEVLTITLNNPSRHNALDRELRDGLVAAFDASINDSTITRIRLCGSGASFCSGGELNEFGSNQDLAVAHLIRLDRSIATRVEKCRDRVEVELHGACFGAGIEIPSFAGKITARDDTVIQLPEVSMGLVPGAGGTVGITRRIGRWRMAYLAITGEPIGRDTALEWGLVDERRL